MTPIQNDQLLNVDKDDLIEVDINFFSGGNISFFNLYVKSGDKFVLYAQDPYQWQEEEVNRLIKLGHSNLFYHKNDESKLKSLAAIKEFAPLEMASEPKKRIVTLTDSAAEMTKVLYEYPLNSALLDRGRQIAEAMVDCVLEDISCIAAMQKLALHDEYTYYHSARVAAYALALALKMTLSERQQLLDLTLGCLLHDIGKSKIDIKIINKPDKLNTDEWQIIRKHPEFGQEITLESQLAFASREIIVHHHERLDGKGYPHGLSKIEQIEEVRIASFADLFDALTTNRPYQTSRSKFEALNFIRDNLLKSLDDKIYKAMIELLKEKL